MITQLSYTAESPLGQLFYQTGAALAEGLIKPGCPHATYASTLLLPLHLGTLLCSECAADMVTDPGPGECAACGGPDGCLWYLWLDVPARVVVTARICARCLKAGNLSMAAN